MPSQRDLYLAAYDIHDPKRLSRALYLVRGHATGGQKSVHEIYLSPTEKTNLLSHMHDLITEEDRFMLMRLRAGASVFTRGIGKKPAKQNYFYLG